LPQRENLGTSCRWSASIPQKCSFVERQTIVGKILCLC
jgi:hypothetical protein